MTSKRGCFVADLILISHQFRRSGEYRWGSDPTVNTPWRQSRPARIFFAVITEMKPQQQEPSPRNATYPIVSVVNATNRILTSFVLALAMLGLGQSALAYQSGVGRNGNTILHFTFNSAMTNSGVAAGAKGSVSGTLRHTGNANYLMLKIALTKLAPTTTYQLAALIGDDTNSTSVTEFTTTKKGAFAVTYEKYAWNGTSKKPFPDALIQLLTSHLDRLHITSLVL